MSALGHLNAAETVAKPERGGRRRTAYLLLLPGGLWLILFFVVPLVSLLAASLYDPNGSIEFLEPRSGALARYRFGQRTADFLICRNCGVYLGAVIDSPSGRLGIINVNALRLSPSALPVPKSMDYDSETSEQRIARRQQRWSPVIGVV